jgi:hypothetical protein
MTHDETSCPLAIGIQAPWGGGKTSLMRMIQRELDPGAKSLRSKRIRDFREPETPTRKLKSSDEPSWSLERIPRELLRTCMHCMPFIKRESKSEQEISIREVLEWIKPNADRELPTRNISIPNRYVFSWEDIPGRDEGRLRDLLINKLGIDWANIAKIEKVGDGKTIKVSGEKNSLSLNLNDKNTKVILEIDDLIRDELIAKNENGELKIYPNSMLTIWFNPWKYENSDQVWAGLADSIIKQVAERLPFGERERFYLMLNLKRMDADVIRSEVHQRIFDLAWMSSYQWLSVIGAALLISALTALAGSISSQAFVTSAGKLGILASFSLGGINYAINLLRSMNSVNEEPSSISLNKYLQVPDYNRNLGFIHYAEADLRHVFETIPPQYLPVVIFIDDLDRCSPKKISEVMEGINLFLAGEFMSCIFVLGMDAEIVAASLDAAHEEVLKHLPLSSHAPVGWRFMDKFIQLPFVIPRCQEYGRLIDSTSCKRSMKVGPTKSTISGPPSEDVLADGSQTRQDDEEIRKSINRKKRSLDQKIAEFNDQNEDIQRIMRQSAEDLEGNPRQFKRFMNSFRFQYFLWSANDPSRESINIQQLRRWVVLFTNWPDVARWARAESGRFKLLEEIGSGTKDMKTWYANAKEFANLEAKDTLWLNDDRLRKFFNKESSQIQKGQRLSDGEGKGLW